MREFICGYQSLVSCGGELVGFAIFVVCLLFFAGWYVKDWWDRRRKRRAVK